MSELLEYEIESLCYYRKGYFDFRQSRRIKFSYEDYLEEVKNSPELVKEAELYNESLKIENPVTVSKEVPSIRKSENEGDPYEYQELYENMNSLISQRNDYGNDVVLYFLDGGNFSMKGVGRCSIQMTFPFEKCKEAK